MEKKVFFVSPKKDMAMEEIPISTRLLAGCKSLNIYSVAMLLERIKQKDEALLRTFGGESRNEIASLFKKWNIPITGSLELSEKKEYVIVKYDYVLN